MQSNSRPPHRNPIKFFQDLKQLQQINDPVALRKEIMDSMSNDKRGLVINYFQNYFESGGNANHPLLGDLNVLADQLDQDWDSDNGINITSGMIKYNLGILSNSNTNQGSSVSMANVFGS